MSEVEMIKSELETAKKELTELGKVEGEDVLKGLVKILEKFIVSIAATWKFGVYILPLLPMVVKMLNEAIDKIDGQEG